MLKKLRIADIVSLTLFLLLLPIGYAARRLRGPLWLFSERPAEARDNAYWLFKYIHDNALHQNSYYVIDKSSPDVEKLLRVAPGRVIPFGSLRHYLFFIASTVHVSAHIGGGMPNARVVRQLEQWKLLRNSKVFLQHGVIKDTLDWAFRQHAHIDLFCCSGQREMDHILGVYGYTANQVALTGLCRFDQLIDRSPLQAQRFILVIPTWRKYLASVDEADFRSSPYFKAYTSLLRDDSLIRALESQDLHLVFHLHPGMQRFTHLFSSHSNTIKISDASSDMQPLLRDASLLVTDYSSVFFDFVYMGKSVIYYQFDYEDFRDGHWSTGYFEYDRDGFGPVTRDKSQLMDAINKVINDQFTVEPKYRARVDTFFEYRDTNNCSRTYDAIMALPKRP